MADTSNSTEINDAEDSDILRNINSEDTGDDDLLIEEIKKKFSETESAWTDIRTSALDDLKFARGMDDEGAFARANAQRGGQPKVSQNEIPNLVQQVENVLRQLNPSCTVHATDEKGSDEMCTIMQGMIRHIERISDAERAYLSAGGQNGALVPGFGFVKLCTKAREKSFEQDIFIEEVKDPFKVMPEFTAKRSDFSDAKFWFEFDNLSKDSYRDQYPDSKLASVNWHATGDGWLMPHEVRIVTYWYTQIRRCVLLQFETGDIGYDYEYGLDGTEPIFAVPMVPMTPPEQVMWVELHPEELDIPTHRAARVVNERADKVDVVKWVVTNGMEILDRGTWHDNQHPFVAFVGSDQIIDGKRHIHGIVHYCKDSQKMINYLASQLITKMSAANKAPWLIDVNSVSEKHRSAFETSNRENWAALYFDSTGGKGTQPMFSPPQRLDQSQPAIDGILAAKNVFEQGLKQTIGVTQAINMTAPKVGMSGIAVETLAQAGKEQNFHFSDNFVQGIKTLTKRLIRLIPKIYDSAQVVRIIGADDKPELVKINQTFFENGQQKHYDVANADSYDCDVSVGPSFATKKAEQNALLVSLANTNPAVMPLLLDLITKNMEGDLSQVVTDRVAQWQAVQMPWLKSDFGGDDIPPAVKAQLIRMQQQLEQANQHVQTLSTAYQTEKAKADSKALDAHAQQQIQMIKSYTDLQVAQIDAEAKIRNSENDYEIDKARLNLDHITKKQQVMLQGLKHLGITQFDNELDHAIHN